MPLPGPIDFYINNLNSRTMVLENLFPEKWLERKTGYAFLMAILYSSIGIITSRLLFGANSGIVSVFFTSMLMLSCLRKLFQEEEEISDVKHYKKELFSDNIRTFKVYIFAFMGIYLTYAAFTFLMPLYGIDPTPFFREQLMMESSVRGNAYSFGYFASMQSS